MLGVGGWGKSRTVKIALGTTTGADDMLDLVYMFDNGTNLHKNNGNVISQVISVLSVGSTTGFVATQAYTYDELNRLKSATENSIPTGGSSAQSWKQTYSFDRFGNRRFDTTSGATTTIPGGCSTSVCNPTFDLSDNRFADEQGYDYDDAGNVTQDAEGKKFVYDADNKQKSFGTGGDDDNGGTYFYDGDGRRVKKQVGTEVTVFVYDAAGQLVAEYTTTAPSSPLVSYLTADHLGSPRINTDTSGAVLARHDYMPFGEELLPVGDRSEMLGFGSDGIRQKFTGYERDLEAELDFAKARMLSYGRGRFTSPDDFLRDTKTVEPMSWNLYVYVRNNPLKFVDPTGATVDGSQLDDETRRKLIEEFARLTGYRVEDLSFGSNGLLSIADGAVSEGGSAKARELLNKAISSDWEFVLELANSASDFAFARHVPTLKGTKIGPNGTPISRGVYGRVRIDLDDFSNAVFDSPTSREAYSVGIAVLHEFVHGLYPGLLDNKGATGEIEENWINPIRAELGLPQRDSYSAPMYSGAETGNAPDGVRLSFTRMEDRPDPSPSFRNPFPSSGKLVPITYHIYWRNNTIGATMR